jgi:hypothetical protein
MASDVNSLTVNYEQDGVLLVKELDKAVLSNGAWATLIFKYQDFDQRSNTYRPEKYSIRRFRKMNDEYRQQSKFTISSRKQAQKIIDVLSKWLTEGQQN